MAADGDLENLGWMRFPVEPSVLDWARAARAVALKVASDPRMQAQWLQCEGTWFVGVDALPNGPDGAVGGTPLRGAFQPYLTGADALHRAQVSIIYPGYPRPRAGESEANFRYRQTRFAAHVDGITAEGPDRRRFVTESHAWILGLPLSEASPEASPLVVWEGSHKIIRRALAPLFDGKSKAEARTTDVTEAYQTARREVFASCPVRRLSSRPGEALLLHRLCLHGIAPWGPQATAAREGRMTAYFRPLIRGGVKEWLTKG